jgi:hypothetical protein
MNHDNIIDNDLATEDELCLIHFLLSKTLLQVKVDGTFGKELQALIGIPLGDSLSLILLLSYLEHILRTTPGDQITYSTDVMLVYADVLTIALHKIAEEANNRLEDKSEGVPHLTQEYYPCLKYSKIKSQTQFRSTSQNIARK